MLTKALIDNHEFHEKLAENINKVRTPEVVESIASVSNVKVPTPPVELAIKEKIDPCSSNLIYQSSFYTELDNAFKKIVQDTESDPVFKNILLDVITEENSDDCEDRGISHTSTPNKQKTDQKNDGKDKESEKTNERQDLTSKHTPSKIIDDQNADAIQSIIAVNSKQQEQKQETGSTKKRHDLNATMDSMLCDSHLNTSNDPVMTTVITETTTTVTTTVTTTTTTVPMTTSSVSTIVPSTVSSTVISETSHLNTSLTTSIPQSKFYSYFFDICFDLLLFLY